MTDSGPTDADDGTDGTEAQGTQVAQRHYEPDGDGDLTTAIISGIAEAEGVAPSEVKSPPLYESVDAAAIEGAFFGPSVAGETRQCVGTVEFQYAGYLVTVRSDGWIRVYEQADADRP